MPIPTPVNLMTNTTGAATSTTFSVGFPGAAVYRKATSSSVTVYRRGTLGSGETIDLQVQDDLGAWENATDLAGADISLTDIIQSIKVVGDGTFRMNKGTTSAAGVYAYGHDGAFAS